MFFSIASPPPRRLRCPHPSILLKAFCYTISEASRYLSAYICRVPHSKSHESRSHSSLTCTSTSVPAFDSIGLLLLLISALLPPSEAQSFILTTLDTQNSPPTHPRTTLNVTILPFCYWLQHLQPHRISCASVSHQSHRPDRASSLESRPEAFGLLLYHTIWLNLPSE